MLLAPWARVTTIRDLYEFAWKIDVMDDVVRVKAATRETAESPEGAFRLAVQLQEAVLGTEYRTRWASRLVVVDDGATKHEPPQRWRGGVDFGVVPVQGFSS